MLLTHTMLYKMAAVSAGVTFDMDLNTRINKLASI